MFETEADLKLKETLSGVVDNVGIGHNPVIIGDSAKAGKTLRDMLLSASSGKEVVVYGGYPRMGGKSFAHRLASICETAKKAGITVKHLCEMTEKSNLSLQELSGKLVAMASSGANKANMESFLMESDPKAIKHYDWEEHGEPNSTKKGFNQNEISKRRKKNKLAKKNKRKNR